MAITIKEIAEYAGVSRGTVDRALNNREGINPEVAARIRGIAAEMGYTPNRAGKALASKKNPIQIGVILNSIGNPFYDDVIKGIYAAKQEFRDFSVKVHIRHLKGYNITEQLRQIDYLLELGVSAIVITPINDRQIRDKINQLTAENVVVVKLNSDIEGTDRAVYIGCNYEKSGATAAGLLGLFSGGNARIGIVMGSVKMLGHTQRVNGFISVCQRDFPGMEIKSVVENNDDDDISCQVTKKLLSDPDIDAVFFTAGGVGGGSRAIDSARPEKRPITICCDATTEIKALLNADKINATVCQQPFKQGYESIKTIFNFLMTGEFPFAYGLFMENEIKIKYNL